MGTKRLRKKSAAQSKLNTEAKMIGIIEYGRIHDYDPMIKDMIIKDFLSFREVEHVELLFPGDALEVEFNTDDEYFAMSLLEELAEELADIGIDTQDVYLK
jgi:hypothetical protein